MIELYHGLDHNNKYYLLTGICGNNTQELTSKQNLVLDFENYTEWHKEMLIYNLKT